jgi:predicted membrane channel-forming protein YqfA (hemolysin III family)
LRCFYILAEVRLVRTSLAMGSKDWYNQHMSKNPIINALSAAAYIILVVSVMTFVTQPLKNKPDTFFAPITFLSVLTLSVAVMAFLFFYQPLQLFIEEKKKEAVKLFVQTVGAFGVITAVVLLLLFSGRI